NARSTVLRLRVESRPTTTGPNEMFGTNLPSMISRWIQSAPALSTAFTSSAKWPKSADKIDGAMTSLFIGLIWRFQAGTVQSIWVVETPALPAQWPPAYPLPPTLRQSLRRSQLFVPAIALVDERFNVRFWGKADMVRTCLNVRCGSKRTFAAAVSR